MINYSATESLVNTGRKANIFMMSLIVLHLFYTLMPVHPGFFTGLVHLFIIILWTVLFFISQAKYHIFEKYRKLISLLLIYCSIVIGYKLLNVSTISWGVIYLEISAYVTLLMGLYIMSSFSEKQLKIIFLLTIIFYLFNIIYNFRWGYATGAILEGEIVNDESISGIANSHFNEAAMFTLFSLYANYSKGLSKFYKIFALIIMVLSACFIMMCGLRATIIILSIFSFLFMAVAKFGHNNKRTYYSILVVLFFFMYFNLEGILEILIGVAPERIAYRLNDILFTTQNGITENSFSGRAGRMMISLNTWIKTPISFLFGAGDIGGEIGLFEGIGGHSELIDVLAKFGIVGGLVLYRLFIQACKFLMSFNNDNNKNCIVIFIALFMFCSLVKTTARASVFCSLFIFFPIVSMLFNKYINKY